MPGRTSQWFQSSLQTHFVGLGQPLHQKNAVHTSTDANVSDLDRQTTFGTCSAQYLEISGKDAPWSVYATEAGSRDPALAKQVDGLAMRLRA
jgi:hypothetical protein